MNRKLVSMQWILFISVFVAFLLLIQPPIAAGAASGSGIISVIVQLEDPPLASYTGGLKGLAPTNIEVTGHRRLDTESAASRAYLSYLEEKQKTFEKGLASAIPAARVIHRYTVVLGGMSVLIPEGQVSVLSALPGVKAVYPDELHQADTERSPTFIRAVQLWQQLGGPEKAGEGVIVGVVDTGIWPEHPSFSDPDPGHKPYSAPPADWKGACEAPKDSSTPITCNNKLIGARVFLDTYKAQGGPLPSGEYDSARDSNGHGTHTTSTAAGNYRVKAEILGNALGYPSGIAPRAHVAAYKALGPGGGYTSDLVAAIQKAVADGVDVINYSIGPSSAYLVDPYTKGDDLAFLDAYKAGVFVATSAGNSGPGANTINHLGGWTTTVAASTEDRSFADKLTLTANKGKVLNLAGASLMAGITVPKTLLLASNYGDALCLNPFAAHTFNGEIVACQRGNNARVAKGYNVLQGGAGGMILYNATPLGVSTDNHFLPATHLESDAGAKMLTFYSKYTGVKAKFTKGAATAAKGDNMAAFSSRGGDGQTYGISKPDVTGPGVQILAGHTSTPIDVSGGPSGQLYQAILGTSMSSPHVAGAGALLRALHPTWTPGRIKSALMTTASTARLLKEDGKTLGNAFDYGSGRIDLLKAANPGLTFDVAGDAYTAHKTDLWTVNYPSIYIPYLQGPITIQRTAHSELKPQTRWQISVVAPKDLSIKVPKTLTVPGGKDASFSITVTGTAIPAGQTRFGVIYLTSGGYQAHIPVTVIKRAP